MGEILVDLRRQLSTTQIVRIYELEFKSGLISRKIKSSAVTPAQIFEPEMYKITHQEQLTTKAHWTSLTSHLLFVIVSISLFSGKRELFSPWSQCRRKHFQWVRLKTKRFIVPPWRSKQTSLIFQHRQGSIHSGSAQECPVPFGLDVCHNCHPLLWDPSKPFGHSEELEHLLN